MPARKWPVLLAECKRILRPGGFLIVTELDLGITNSAAMDQFILWIGQILKYAGFSFSPAGRTIGVVAVLPSLLRQAGFEALQKRASLSDASFGQEQHDGWIEDVQVLLDRLAPLLTGRNLASDEQLEQIKAQFIQEVNDPGFCNLAFLFSVSGQKPS